MFEFRDPYYLMASFLGNILLPGVMGILTLKYLLNFKGGFMTAWLGFTLGFFIYQTINFGCVFFTTYWFPEYFYNSVVTPPYISLIFILISLMLVYLLKGGGDYDPFFKGQKNKSFTIPKSLKEETYRKKNKSKK